MLKQINSIKSVFLASIILFSAGLFFTSCDKDDDQVQLSTINFSPTDYETTSLQSVFLKVAITGTAPWTFEVSDGDSVKSYTTSSSSFSFEVSPTQTTTYTITSLKDANGNDGDLSSGDLQAPPRRFHGQGRWLPQCGRGPLPAALRCAPCLRGR